MIKGIRPFRHAASIILTSDFRFAKPRGIEKSISKNFDKNSGDASNLAVLAVKRKPSSSFMPSMVVFPGGEIDEADFHTDYALAYKEIFLHQRKKSIGSSHDQDFIDHISKLEKTDSPKLPAYEALRPIASSSNGVRMPPEWAFRICALRELFEECGILTGYSLKNGQFITVDSKNNDGQDWDSGRRRVRESAAEFVKLSVHELGVVPSFWELFDWSNWLAPSVYKQRSRFDTLFYVGFTDTLPEAVVNVEELEAGEWSNPKDVLKDYVEGKVLLAPPQIYELGRLANFASMDELRSFCANRTSQSLLRLYPTIGVSSDGLRLCILPGDDLYPTDVDEEAFNIPVKQFNETADVLRSKSKNLHRLEFDKNIQGTHFDVQYKNAKVLVNISQPYGHVSPISI